MEVKLEPLFISHLKNCPTAFQMQFRHCYEDLKAAKAISEVEGIFEIGKIRNIINW